jgi:hypothetical protein
VRFLSTIAQNYFQKSRVLGSDKLPSEEDEMVAMAAMVVGMGAAANSMWFIQEDSPWSIIV